MIDRRVFCAGVSAGALLLLALAPRAQAQSCGDLANAAQGIVDAGDENPVAEPVANILYVGGTAAAQPVFQGLADALGSDTSIVYLAEPSCQSVQDLGTGASETVPSPSATYLDPSQGIPVTCNAAGVVLDVAVSDVFADTCYENLKAGALTSGENDFLGPVQTLTFAVPSASTESVINAEAAYVVFGFGGSSYAVSPWTDPASIFLPTVDDGTLLAGSAIGLLASKWNSFQSGVAPNAAAPDAAIPPPEPAAFGSSAVLVKALAAAKKSSAAIGILPAQAIQGALPRPSLRILAYQHAGQPCGYLPDSDADHLDKINVRQGRYAMWGPLHVVTRVDTSGRPTDHTGSFNSSLTAMIESIVSTGPDPLFVQPGDQWVAQDIDASAPAEDATKLVDQEASAGFVPWCAMQVTRDGEMADEVSYPSPEPCGCHFEETVGATLSYCAVCQDDTDCNALQPICRFGYCESQQ